jgi:hypothetical protein
MPRLRRLPAHPKENPAVTDHAGPVAVQDDDYWRQFQATVSFLEPCEVTGTLETRGKLDTREGPAPQLRIRLDNGSVVIVNAVQTRLLSELVRLQPAVGDRIRIVYRGTAGKAAPGMHPTKEFTVAVRPAGARNVDPATGEIERAADPDPTVAGGTAVDAPGPDPRTASATVDGPSPPASTDTAVPGPGPDAAPGYVDPDGKVHVPDGIRADVAHVKARIAALTPLEKEAFRGWLAKAKIPDSVDVSEAKIRAVNAELDRRAAQPSPPAP